MELLQFPMRAGKKLFQATDRKAQTRAGLGDNRGRRLIFLGSPNSMLEGGCAFRGCVASEEMTK